MKVKRCKIVKMSTEARVLKTLRTQSKLSMREAGFRIGKSDSYISHVENGRIDLPEGKSLMELLSVYQTPHDDFVKALGVYKEEISKLDILFSLLKKLDEKNVSELLNSVEGLLSNTKGSLI
jgi:transcriptional regulator with XRE-family HTH domain